MRVMYMRWWDKVACWVGWCAIGGWEGGVVWRRRICIRSVVVGRVIGKWVVGGVELREIHVGGEVVVE